MPINKRKLGVLALCVMFLPSVILGWGLIINNGGDWIRANIFYADTRIETPLVSTVSLTADSITLNGDTRTVWPNLNGTINIYGTGTVQWLIQQNGTDTKATNLWTGISFQIANFTQAANWVLGNCSASFREEVVFLGDFNQAAGVIEVPDNVVLTGYGARIELTGDCDAVFQSDNLGSARSEWVIIRGFILDGNKAARSKGSGIRGTFYNAEFYDLVIQEFDDWGIDLHSYAALVRSTARIHHNWIGNGVTGGANQDGGIRLGHNGYATADCIITQNYMINNGNYQLKIEQGATHRIGFNHFAGWADAGSTQCVGIYIGPGDVDNVQIYVNHFEQIYKEAIYIEAAAGAFSDFIDITGNNIYAAGRGVNNTYPCIHAYSNGGSTRYGKISDNTSSSNQATMKANYFIYLHGANTDNWLIDSNSIQISGGGAAAWVDLLDESGGTTTLGDNVGIS